VIERDLLGASSDPQGSTRAAPEAIDSSGPVTIPPMSTGLTELIEQRHAVRTATYSPGPAAGQGVVVAHTLREVDSDAEGPRPLVVLLNEPAPEPNVWHGWVAAPEASYAGFWDFLLQEAADHPFDPAAAMVQVWNPVYVRFDAAPIVVAELKPKRLAALRALAHEFSRGLSAPARVAPRPGAVWQRLVSEHQVFTGTPFGDADDPRWEYQEIYLRAAEIVRAQLSAAHSEPESPVAHLARRIREWAATSGQSWTPVDVVAEPMGREATEAEAAASYQLGDLLRVTLISDVKAGVFQVRTILTRRHGLQLALLCGEDTLQKHELNTKRRAADFFLEQQQGACVLQVTDLKNKSQYRIPLT